jgi:hypothetical protein
LTHALLPSELKAGLPDPQGLQGKSVEEIRAALSQINQRLGASMAGAQTSPARLDFAQPAGPRKLAQAAKRAATAPIAGSGTDNDGNCAPLHDARIHWFALKNFLSPMKQQWQRSTCWAFTAIGAIESRELVLNANRVNLSEQFLINKLRREWAADDMVESGSYVTALDGAVDRNQGIPLESSWTYNTSIRRQLIKEMVDGKEVRRFVDSCGQAGDVNPYTGTCSDSAHQSHQVCTGAARAHCAYETMTATGPTVPASRAIQVWWNGAPFDLARYEFLLNNGHVLLANLPVFDGFINPTTGPYRGLLTDLRGVYTNKEGQTLASSAGDHVVQIVGFIPDNSGGRFIVKNSWGCAHGDAGYVYVPASYVQARFHGMHVLGFESRRSDAWQAEQASRTAAPGILVRTPAPSTDLRVEVELTRFFSITHPVQKNAMLQVTSSLDGQLFNGPWSTDATALIPPLLPATFASEGDRVITLTARLPDSAKTATGSFVLSVRNSAPTVTWQSSGNTFVGEPFPLNALVRDINETDSLGLCRSATWSVDAPDVALVAEGCAQRVRFGTTGDRQVRVTVRDSEGLAATSTLTLSVQLPPLNPFPRVLSYGVYSREITGSVFKFCGDVSQAPGTTLDLRDKGCNSDLGGADPARFSAAITVENPTKEPLANEWKLYVKSAAGPGFIALYGATGEGFELTAFGNSDLVTRECYVDAKVIAPQPERSKSVTVWSGRCTYFGSVLN